MKKNILLLSAIICFLPGLSYTQSTYKKVDDYVKSLKPVTVTEKNKNQVAHNLTDQFSADSLKARALFTFVANYYDYDYNMIKEGFGESTDKGLGVCWQYSQLFCTLADEIGLNTRMIYGWSKTSIKDIGKQNKKSYHAWNMVEINHEWRPLDCTWASGYMDKSKEFIHELNPHYFLTNKEVFALTHHPDSGFQYIAYAGQSFQQFLFAPLYYTSNFIKDFHFIPTNSISVDFSEGKEKDTVVFQFKGNVKETGWAIGDMKGKTLTDITPVIKDDTIMFIFTSDMDFSLGLNIYYDKKAMLALVQL